MATAEAAEGAALKPASAAKQAGAAIIAGGVILGAANLSATSLSGILADDVRSSLVGLMFAGFPVIYGFVHRALNGFQSTKLEFPELYPWYVTGLTAGMSLFAWIQFVAAAAGAAVGIMLPQLGVKDVPVALVAQAAGVMMMPLLMPAAFLAGLAINRSSRGGAWFALILAAILCTALSIFVTWSLQREYTQQMFATVGENPVALIGMASPSIIVLVFGALGIGWSALWRERSLGRVAHAARRLTPAQRDELMTHITAKLEENAG